MPVPLRRPRTPPALPPRPVPSPPFRGFLTSSYAPPILPGPSTRIVLCEPVDEPTGRPSRRPPPAAPSSRPTQRRRHAVWPPCTTARPPSSGGFRRSPCWLIPASCHTPSAGGLYHVDAEVSLWRGFRR